MPVRKRGASPTPGASLLATVKAESDHIAARIEAVVRLRNVRKPWPPCGTCSFLWYYFAWMMNNKGATLGSGRRKRAGFSTP
jgi:hypothetical protein